MRRFPVATQGLLCGECVAAEAFFRSLPQSGYSDGEVDLRAPLIQMIKRSDRRTIDLSQAETLLQTPIQKLLLPHGVSLARWVHDRCGNEFVIEDATIKSALCNVPAQNRVATIREKESLWLARLPKDEISEQENRLRMALIEYLNEWGHNTGKDPDRYSPGL